MLSAPCRQYGRRRTSQGNLKVDLLGRTAARDGKQRSLTGPEHDAHTRYRGGQRSPEPVIVPSIPVSPEQMIVPRPPGPGNPGVKSGELTTLSARISPSNPYETAKTKRKPRSIPKGLLLAR